MNVIFAPQAWEDYEYWLKNDKRVLKRIHLLIKDVQRSPFDGMGKPEALKHHLSGYWSRRINEEHRIIYRVTDAGVVFFQLRYHYTS